MPLNDQFSQLSALAAQIKRGFVAALPNIVTALIVLALGWVLAWTLRRLILAAFRRMGPRIDEPRTAGLAAGAMFWFVLAATFVASLEALNIPLLERWMGAAASYLPRFGFAAAVVVGGIVLGRLASIAIVRAGVGFSARQSRRLGRLTRVAIIVTATLIAAAQVGLDVSLVTSFFLIAWAAALSAAALAFGLGARQTIANILAMHYTTQSYRVGQRVRIGSDEGRIVRTTTTAVYLESPEGELSIPGQDFLDSRCVLLSEEGDHGP